MKDLIIARLRQNGGYNLVEILDYWDVLECDLLPPAVAYIAVDSCFKHSSSVVDNWLRVYRMRELNNAVPLEQELVNYLVEMRRRALKSRMDWPERRYEWTNQINRAKHYAGKFYTGAEDGPGCAEGYSA